MILESRKREETQDDYHNRNINPQNHQRISQNT